MTTQPFWQKAEDWHTAGQPFRVIQELPLDYLTKGLTVSQQKQQITNTPWHPLDLLRQSLCHEPRGRPDIYGGFVTPPNDKGAHFGVLFWHKDGFSTACGHGIIALGYWVITNGIVKANPGGTTDIVIDVPSGRVTARATTNDVGTILHMDFINVASHQISEGDMITIDLSGKPVTIPIDMSFAGAVIVSVNAADLNVAIEPRNHRQLIDIAKQIKEQRADFLFLGEYSISNVYFFQDQGENDHAVYQKNVNIYADGQIDRSPCGSGTCARFAILLVQGKVSKETSLVHESIVGTKFEAHVVDVVAGEGSFPSCIPRVRGTAHLTGRMEFFIDPTDPLYPGFVL